MLDVRRVDPMIDAAYHLDNWYGPNPYDMDGISIYQIGRLFSKSTTVIRQHPHRGWYELTIITSGKGVITTNGVPSDISRGDIYIGLPGDLHQIETDKEELLHFDFFSFLIQREDLSEDYCRMALEIASPADRIIRNEQIAGLVSSAIMETISGEQYAATALNAICHQILIYTLRAVRDRLEKSGTSLQNDVLCCTIMHYIDTHIYSIKKLSEISEQFGYSYGYLSGLFRRVTSGTISDYYTDRRLKEVCTLLSSGNHTVSEIGERLHYSSGYALSNAFHKKYGISPSEYRKQCGIPFEPKNNL